MITALLAAVLTNGALTVNLNEAKGGIVDSLVWRGVELVDGRGVGRGIQTAWQYGDRGECANPTQGGNEFDEVSLPPSGGASRVLSVKRGEVVTRPAWWVPEGTAGGSLWCDWSESFWGEGNHHADAGVKGTLSNSRIRTKVALLTPRKIVLTMTVTVTSAEALSFPSNYYLLQVPFLALSTAFSKAYRLHRDGALFTGEPQGYARSAPVVCDDLETTCLGWYSVPAAASFAGHPHEGYLGHDLTDLRAEYGCWISGARISVAPGPGQRNFYAKIFLGTSPSGVAASMLAAGWPLK